MILFTAHLERAGIAWPNPKMFETPLHSEADMVENGLGGAHGFGSVDHRRTYSNDSATTSSPMRGLPMPPPPTPALGHYDIYHAMQAGNPQCFHNAATNGSAFSDTISGHELQNAFGSVAFPYLNESSRGTRTQLEIRLPSDQLQKLISAISPSKQTGTQSTDSTQMPPPPLPLHALAAKAGGSDQTANVDSKVVDTALSDSTHVGLPNTSRGSSDVSMHAGCTYFPACTSEDDSSLVVHGNPACPSADIKGRKEGSSPLKRKYSGLTSICGTFTDMLTARDFLSTIIGSRDNNTVSPVTDDTKSSASSDSPVETPGRKRTRSALKALNINDGSPEKKEASARKPSRKVSRASSSGSKRVRDNFTSGGHVRAGMVDDEDKENQMVLDA
jgi:hypothetical protein